MTIDHEAAGTELGLVALTLAEIDPVLAEVLLATGANAGGMALPGLLGWLPMPDLITVVKAVLLVRDDERGPVAVAVEIRLEGAWRHPRWVDRPRMAAGMKVWAEANLR